MTITAARQPYLRHDVSAEEDARSARADGRTPQASLLVMVPIKPDRLEDLTRLLHDIADPPGGGDLETNAVVPFRKLRTIHFARILIHESSPSEAVPIPEWNGEPQVTGDPIPATLLFATDYDGELTTHLDELFDVAGPGLATLFEHCDGWPGGMTRESVHAFFHRFSLRSNTFYTGTMNRSVSQILREAELRQGIEEILDALVTSGTCPSKPAAIREAVLARIRANPRFSWTKERPGPLPTPLLPQRVVDHLPKIALAGVGLVALVVFIISVWLGLALVAAAAAAFLYLRHLSATDPVIIRPDVQGHTARLVKDEDRIVQNQMSSVIYIKRPLWFRRLVLSAVLAFINLSAKYLSNTGTLAGIPSIHFARWVMVDGNRRLLFFSNFDGSWENYLGDFIDKAHAGLTAVWSNCVGFPRTELLTGKGASDEQRFKAYSRQSQVVTQVWYSAYRWLSVSNINDNSRLRHGLYSTMNDAEADAWLRMATPRGQERPVTAKPAYTGPLVETADVQGLVVRSYAALREAVYLPVSFDPNRPQDTRAWLAKLIPAITPASVDGKSVETAGRALNVAFTYPGLVALGVEAMGVTGFSREFTEGMAAEHRQRILGDLGAAHPDRWKWGGPADTNLHAMLFLYAGSRNRLNEMLAEEELRAHDHGVTLRPPLDSIMLPREKEHFGFHDGIAQPRIAGLKGERSGPADAAAAIPPGEVILGYENAYGIVPMSPTAPDRGNGALARAGQDLSGRDASAMLDLGRNGSYVVFRQLEQDVKGFWAFLDRAAQSDPARRKLLGAKMVGRWPNGAPLVRYPDQEPASYDDTSRANDFWYKKDLAGDRCPIGSHIRRSNPRDGLMPNRADSLIVADRHRLLRRGRAYGQPIAESFDPEDILRAPENSGERGLHFVCFNTDLARQFEFVQDTWVNSMKFEGLYSEPDPVAAPHVMPAEARHPEEVSTFRFLSPGCPVRHRVEGVPRFVTMVGGAYLFMPGLRSLGYLARPHGSA